MRYLRMALGGKVGSCSQAAFWLRDLGCELSSFRPWGQPELPVVEMVSRSEFIP